MTWFHWAVIGLWAGLFVIAGWGIKIIISILMEDDDGQ